MGGVFREVVRPEKLVAMEKVDDSWCPGDGMVAGYNRLDQVLASFSANG